LRSSHPDANAHFGAWLSTLPIATGHEFISRGIHWLLGLSSRTIGLFGGVVLGYATLYGVEGFGLWRHFRWAEYLTVISTSLFIPVEIWEMIMRFTPMKLLTLAINVAIVAYLVYLLRAERAPEHEQAPVAARSASTTRT